MEPAGQNEFEGFSKEPSQALEEMMMHYGNTVIRTAYFYTGDPYLAEDISQEVFVRAYRNWLGFRGNSTVKTWLTRITINVCRDKLGLKMSSEQPTDPELLHGVHPIAAEEEALLRLSRTTILNAVLNLPGKYREALYLYYYLDLSTREIAETTGVPEGTVRGRLHRARQMLGDNLQEEGER